LIGSQDKQVTSRDIERDTDLRQPPVAISLGSLVERKWVQKIPVDKKSSLYQIKDIKSVFDGIEKEQQRNILDVQSTMSKLKAAMIPEPKGESQKEQKKEL
jgi:predicted transcriptional regulator